MERNHKHKGAERSNGSLRSHPVDREHKDKNVKRYHNLELANYARQQKSNVRFAKKALSVKAKTKPKSNVAKVNKPYVKPELKKVATKEETKFPIKQAVTVPVDEDGFMRVDLTKTNHNGVRIQFVRVEGRKRRTVGVEIKK